MVTSMKDDVLLRKTWMSLNKDFHEGCLSTNHFETPYNKFRVKFAKGGAAAVRDFVCPDMSSLSTYDAKRWYQLASFGKRWLFDGDLHTVEGLEIRGVKDFITTQSEVISTLPYGDVTNLVLDGAAELCAYILGSYDEEEHKRSCRFGSKAAFGLKKMDAYLFNRIPKLSATRSQVKHFGHWLVGDPQLREIVQREIAKSHGQVEVKMINVTDHLVLTAVPKSYKAARMIVPDTVLGGFISNGLGAMIQKRLAVNAGLDIRTKQREHKRMAQIASRTGHLTTADMSKASDRISWPLLQRILPSDWLDVIEADRVHEVVYQGDEALRIAIHGTKAPVRIKTASCLLMGKGYTFPLQTLVFYSLLLSIANQLGIGHKYVSVYGDDLIYPQKMHPYVDALFPKFGLKLNREKTFSVGNKKGCFRESCGGDYLRGVDVRPYMPEGVSGDPDREDTPAEHAMLCYTLLNGLLEKWHWSEIRATVRFLLIEAQNCFGEILVVPSTDAVSSGLRMDKDRCAWVAEIEETFSLCFPRITRAGVVGQCYYDSLRYKGLTKTPPKVEVEDEYIYMWEALRSSSVEEKEVLHLQDPTFLKLRNVPGILAEWATVEAPRWEARQEMAVRRSRKAWIDRNHQIHIDRPEMACQMIDVTYLAVPSRATPGTANMVQKSCHSFA